MAQKNIIVGIQTWAPTRLTIGFVIRVTTVNTMEYISVAVLTPVILKPKFSGKLSEMAFAALKKKKLV